MKQINYILIIVAGMLLMHSCKDEEVSKGNPLLTPQTTIASAMFGDSLQFTVDVSDQDVPLSTLKAQIFFGEEMVSEIVIRTKTNDEYTGKIFVPFYANIPNATATLRYVLQNIRFTINEQDFNLPLTRPDFPYLTLVDENGNEYRMERKNLYEYEVKGGFPKKLKAYIKAPKVGENGNEILFGRESGTIVTGTDNYINFSSAEAGDYTVSFNTYSFEAAPFTKIFINDQEMLSKDAGNLQLDLGLTQGQMLTVSGIANYDDWWIDPDYFTKEADGKLTFLPVSGQYRIIANLTNEYFRVERLLNGETATLQSDGTGAIWIIGDNIGKPSVSGNPVGWTPDNALCMPSIATGKYQITVTAGKNITAGTINFKFFHQKGWSDNGGAEFTGTTLTTTSDLITVGNVDGEEGNIKLAAGKTFEVGSIYVFTIDVSAGINNAVLTVTKNGEEELPGFDGKFDGVEMTMVDDNNYKVEKNFTQNQQIEITGSEFSGWETDWWVDPAFFTVNDGKLTFLPVSGKYRVTANKTLKYFIVEAMNGDVLATLQADGTGALWIIGDNEIGKPSYDANPIDWSPDKAICMAQTEPKKYQVKLVAGKNIITSSVNFKLFQQKGWGGEFSHTQLTTTSDIVYVGDGTNGRDSGNLGVSAGKSFTEGKTYIFTVDLTGGNENAVLTVTEE